MSEGWLAKGLVALQVKMPSGSLSPTMHWCKTTSQTLGVFNSKTNEGRSHIFEVKGFSVIKWRWFCNWNCAMAAVKLANWVPIFSFRTWPWGSCNLMICCQLEKRSTRGSCYDYLGAMASHVTPQQINLPRVGEVHVYGNVKSRSTLQAARWTRLGGASLFSKQFHNIM